MSGMMTIIIVAIVIMMIIIDLVLTIELEIVNVVNMEEIMIEIVIEIVNAVNEEEIRRKITSIPERVRARIGMIMNETKVTVITMIEITVSIEGILTKILTKILIMIEILVVIIDMIEIVKKMIRSREIGQPVLTLLIRESIPTDTLTIQKDIIKVILIVFLSNYCI